MSTGSQLINKNRHSCGCINFTKRRGPENPQWIGVGELRTSHFNTFKRGAKDRQLEFTISIEYAWNLFLKQDRKCSISGLTLTMPISRLTDYHDASLDRIDSSKGYIEGNIQWIHKIINKMKSDLDQSEFIKYCKIIANKL